MTTRLAVLLRICICLCLFSCFVFSGDVKAVVKVSKMTLKNGVVYEYFVTNCSDVSIWRFVLGSEPNEDPVLDVEASRVESPGTWSGDSRWLEGSEPGFYSVDWKQRENVAKAGELIKPGETKSGFKVLVPKMSHLYEGCVYTIYFLRKGDKYVSSVELKK